MGKCLMAALGGNEISERLKHPNLTHRLIVTPLLAPAEQLRRDQASIDVRLGFQFALVSPSVSGSIDEFAEDRLPRLSTDLYRKEYVPLGGSLIIHPHQFILASTLEYIRLPTDLMSYGHRPVYLGTPWLDRRDSSGNSTWFRYIQRS